jgi:hypothetical protein
MSNTSDNHGEVSELLPWYVNGTLDKEECQLVRQHVDNCPDCRDDFEFLCRVNSVVNKSSPAPIVPQPRVEEFFSTFDTDRDAEQRRRSLPRWAIAASRLIAALAVAVVLGNRFVVTESPTRFETATSAQSIVSMDYVLRIRFEPETETDTQNAIISSLDGRDVTADGKPDAYRLIVSVPATSLEEIESFTKSVEARPEVRSVDVVALQLPMRMEK